MKQILKYLEIFLITLFILVMLLVITAKIPRSMIQNNIKESKNAFRTMQEIDEVVKKREYTYLHVYADNAILNIIYCIDTQHPIKAVMEAKYYSEHEEKIVSNKLEEIVDCHLEGNVNYFRYWHGSIAIVRPLLIFFNLYQIYIINACILGALAIILIIILLKKKQYELTIAFVLGMVMCATIMVPFCLEYTWTFLIMLITSIIAIFMEKDDKKLNILFFVTGMITCYLDFLTTELITIFVPILIILIIRYKEKRITNFKQGVKFVFKASVLWLTSYVAMWLAKWILASMILKINVFECIKNDAFIRINGTILGIAKEKLPLNAIAENFFTIYPLNIQKRRIKLTGILITLGILEIILIRKKDLSKLWLSGVLVIIALMPYVRYYILANHSYIHSYFTFRSQIITIMALVLAIIYSVDKEILKKEIHFRKIKF